MPLPNKEIEQYIMLAERFTTDTGELETGDLEESTSSEPLSLEIDRDVVLPWWILHLLTEAVAYSRRCSLLDRKPSLRASSRALDHSYASAELERRSVVCLEDACDGLKLAMRGRMELRPDLIDFEDTEATFERIDEVSEDLLWNALEDSAELFLPEAERDKLAWDVKGLLAEGTHDFAQKLHKYQELVKALERLKELSGANIAHEFLSDQERELLKDPSQASQEIRDLHNYSAFQMIVNALLHLNLLSEADIQGKLFVPKMISWGTN